MRVGGSASLPRPDSPLSVPVRLACPVSRPLNLFILPSPLTSTCKLVTRVTRVSRVVHRSPLFQFDLGVRSLFSVQPAPQRRTHSDCIIGRQMRSRMDPNPNGLVLWT